MRSISRSIDTRITWPMRTCSEPSPCLPRTRPRSVERRHSRIAARKITAIGCCGPATERRSYSASSEPPDQKSLSNLSVSAITLRIFMILSKMIAQDQNEARISISITAFTIQSAWRKSAHRDRSAAAEEPPSCTALTVLSIRLESFC